MLAIVSKDLPPVEVEEKKVVIPAVVELPAEAKFLEQPLNVPPQTTAEQDRHSKRQSNINMMWETTQRNIALFVVFLAGLISAFVVVVSVLQNRETSALTIGAFTLLSSAMFLVSGFYFGRTNHARIGDDKDKRNDVMDDRFTEKNKNK